jgi:hypothetical protein
LEVNIIFVVYVALLLQLLPSTALCVSQTGMTPFLFAVWGGHHKTAEMLEEAGADVHHIAHV